MSPALLTEQSRLGLERALHSAIKTHLVRDSADVCVISRSEKALPPSTDGKLIQITISSFTFRLIVMFHIDESPTLSAYFKGLHREAVLEEAFYEVANLSCGALNRYISRDFRHLAMSIPYTLDAACGAYLSELRPEHVSTTIVTINDTIRIALTLCLCCQAPVSFQAAPPQAESGSDGALELF